MRRMGGQDAAFLYGETSSWHMHVSALMILDPSSAPGGWDFDRLRRHTAERLSLVPQFRLQLVDVPLGLDRPGWVESPDFDIDHHVRRIAVPAPGGPRELGELAGRLASYKIDRRKPLWELWVIEGVEGGRVALLYKVHHALIDGVSGMGLAEVSFDLEPEPAGPPAAFAESQKLDGDRHVPNVIERVALGMVNATTRVPYRIARFAVQSVMQGVTAVGFLRRRPVAMPFQAPRTSLNGQFTPHRKLAFTSVSLERVKAIKHAYDVKLNDVVLALCAGALRRYLAKIDDLPEQPLLAQCPVSLRGGGDDAIGSKVGSMFVKLATNVADPEARLLAIHESTRDAKEIGQALSADKILGLTETAPPGLIGVAARMYTAMGLESRVPPPINVVVSNVPGPPFPLYMAGARLESMYPMGPLLLGTGLNITVVSYCGSIDFGFLCCPEMLPEPALVAEGVALALDELEEAAGARAQEGAASTPG